MLNKGSIGYRQVGNNYKVVITKEVLQKLRLHYGKQTEKRLNELAKLKTQAESKTYRSWIEEKIIDWRLG